MTRARQPHNPATGYLATIEVDDPYEMGAKLAAIRSTRNDPLAAMHARRPRTIDDAQYYAGRAYQQDFETAERGPCAIDPGKEAVDGGRMPEAITDAQIKAVKRLVAADRDLGLDGSALIRDFLITGLNMSQIAARRALKGTRWELYFGKRIGECLDRLARTYGLSNG
jgi:hypothetical protein